MTERRILDHPVLGSLPDVRLVSLTIDGVAIGARPGETIAAALLANGIRVFRTMPKTGAPRGGFCFVGRCSDCQMIVDGTPNVMACTTIVRDGMVVETQHGVGKWADRDGAAS